MTDTLATNKVNISGNSYLPELDGLRFLAFMLVFIHHHPFFSTIPYLSFLSNYGWIGVDLFFVLSAFLLTKLLLEEYQLVQSINIKNFYLRRIFRIWPVYFLFIAVVISPYLFLEGFEFTIEISNRLSSLLLFYDNIVTANSSYNPIIGTAHLWTIAYEEQFYICLPVIIILLTKFSPKSQIFILTAILLLLNLIRILFISADVSHPLIWVLPITHFDPIILGIILGFGGFNFLIEKLNSNIIGLAGVFCFIIVCLLPQMDHNSFLLILSYSLVGISTTLILISVLNNDNLKKIFSNNILVYLGKRSYGLYVYHLILIKAGESVLTKIFNIQNQSFLWFAFSLTCTIAVSILSYSIIEKPFLKIKKKFQIINSRPV